jgi:hypothetical protein
MTEAGVTTILVAVAIMVTATITTKAARIAKAAARDCRFKLLHVAECHAFGRRTCADCGRLRIRDGPLLHFDRRETKTQGGALLASAYHGRPWEWTGRASGRWPRVAPLVGPRQPRDYPAAPGEPAISSNVRERQLGEPGYGNPQS